MDDPLYPEDLCLHGALNEYAHLFYSTYHSAPDWPRWRLVILLDRPVSPAQYILLYQKAAVYLGLGKSMDPHTDASRIFFEFHTPNTKDAFSGGREHGEALYVDLFLNKETDDFEEEPIKDSASDFEAFDDAFSITFRS